ncbi:MAG: hypothetical protein ABIH83_03980 [Candidatus Micrarchaeota archaeon]
MSSALFDPISAVGTPLLSEGYAGAYGAIYTGLIPSIAIIGMISLFIVVLLHMIGHAFNIASLRTWAKGEYLQVIITFLLIAAMLATLNIVWEIMGSVVSELFWSNENLSMKYIEKGFTPDNSLIDPFRFTQSFLKQTMIDCEQTVYWVLYTINFFFRLTGSMGVSTMGLEPLGAWYATLYTSSLEYIMGHLNFLVLLHWIQIRLLSIMKYVGPVLIQMGLLLRVFPMSRGAGGLLLAAGFGFFAVYPMSLALLVTLQPPGASFCTEFEPPVYMNIENMEEGPDAGMFALAYYSTVAHENEVVDLIEKAKNFLPLFYMQAAFFPMVALIITFTFIRQTGALFGADLSEIGRGLVKLI